MMPSARFMLTSIRCWPRTLSRSSVAGSLSTTPCMVWKEHQQLLHINEKLMCLFMNISLSGWNGCSLFCWNLLVKNSIHSKHIHEKYLYSDANYLDLMHNMKINLNQTYCVILCFVTYFCFGIYRTKKWPKKMFEFWWYCVCQIWYIYQDWYIFFTIYSRHSWRIEHDC